MNYTDRYRYITDQAAYRQQRRSSRPRDPPGALHDPHAATAAAAARSTHKPRNPRGLDFPP